MIDRTCPSCSAGWGFLSRRYGWERLLGVVLPVRPYRCEKCDHRFWALTPRFFELPRTVFWVLLAFIVLPPLSSMRVPPSSRIAGVQIESRSAPEESSTQAHTAVAETASDAGPELESAPSAPESSEDALRDQILVLEQTLAEAEAELEELAEAVVDEDDFTADVEAPAELPDREEPLGVVRDWSLAWSAQDVDAYLAAYSSSFEPSGGMSRSAWAEQRRQRISTPASIRVSIDDLAIADRDGERVAVEFTQHYESNTYDDTVRKRLVLVLEAGAWKIVREESSG